MSENTYRTRRTRYSTGRRGVNLSGLVMYMEELDKIEARGTFGERETKLKMHYGEKGEPKLYRKGDRYKDIAVRKTVTRAIKRGHRTLGEHDLQVAGRESRGQVQIIYGIDASASMKGDKIATAKKAGVALAYKAIQHKDKVGIMVFGKDVKDKVAPTDDFEELLYHLARIRASAQTDFTALIRGASELFSGTGTKHLIMLTDAMPTVGDKPKEETLEAVSMARAAGISVSVVGIKLDEEATAFAKDIATVGMGRLAIAREVQEIDRIILEDYEALKQGDDFVGV